MPVHLGMDSKNRYVWPHWTATLGEKVAKAANACSNCCEGGKSYTELF